MPLDQETGYLEQGYANVASAPLDMQLDAIQQRKTALSQAQASLEGTKLLNRGRAREEQDDLDADRNMAGFLKLREGHINDGFTGDALHELSVNDVGKNASWTADSEIQTVLLNSGKSQTAQNEIKRRDLEGKRLDLQQKQWDASAEQSNATIEYNRKVLNAQTKRFDDRQFQSLTEDDVNFGADMQDTIGSIVDPEQMKKILGTHSVMNKSEDPELQAGARAIRQIGQAIAVTDNSTRNGKASLDRHLPMMAKLNGLGIETDDLYDPEKVDDAIERIQNSMDKKGGIEEKDYDAVKPLLVAAATFAASYKDGKIIQENLISLLPSISRDLNSLDPDKKEEAQNNLASLSAKAQGQLATARSGANTIATNEDLRKKKNEEEARQLEIRNTKSLMTTREHAAVLANMSAKTKRIGDTIKVRQDATDLYLKLVDDNNLDDIGLNSDWEHEKAVDYIFRFFEGDKLSSSSRPRPPSSGSGSSPATDLPESK
jgi:hypothetical protein